MKPFTKEEKALRLKQILFVWFMTALTVLVIGPCLLLMVLLWATAYWELKAPPLTFETWGIMIYFVFVLRIVFHTYKPTDIEA